MEFPDLVKLDRNYRGRGVTVIGLSLDNPQTARQAVPVFTAQQHVTFPIYILKSGDPQNFIRAFDPNWGGAIPMTYIYDRAGRLQTRLMGAQSLEGFETAVKPLLRLKG